ncbi:MAG: DoxX family protein [Rhodospirillaceae bacterium]
MTTTTKPYIPAVGSLTDALAPLAEPALRVAAGLILVPHGAQKLFGWFGGYGLEATGAFFQTSLGLPPSLALVAGLIEFVGGLMLALGVLTRPVALVIAGFLAVTISIHLGSGFFWSDGGFEYPLLWTIVVATFAIRGGGRYSVDARLGREF